MATSLVSAPWASSADIPDGTTTPPGGWDGPLAEASDILFELSGRQFRGVGQSKVQIRPAGVQELPLLPGWVPTPVPVVPVLGGWFPQQWGLEVVRLPSSPVVSVDEVLAGGDTVDPTVYECDTAGLLRRTDFQPWPCDGTLLVTFTHGLETPEGGRRAAVSLAVEIAKARAGDGSCRLRNFQTITREGVTMAAVNLRDALSSGLTGLYEVDLWLKSVNPNAMRRRGGAWTPDWGRSRRVVPTGSSSMTARPVPRTALGPWGPSPEVAARRSEQTPAAAEPTQVDRLAARRRHLAHAEDGAREAWEPSPEVQAKRAARAAAQTDEHNQDSAPDAVDHLIQRREGHRGTDR